jgi:hypothetical protein
MKVTASSYEKQCFSGFGCGCCIYYSATIGIFPVNGINRAIHNLIILVGFSLLA